MSSSTEENSATGGGPEPAEKQKKQEPAGQKQPAEPASEPEDSPGQKRKAAKRRNQRAPQSRAKTQKLEPDKCRCESPAEEPSPSPRDNICAACQRPIRERYLLVALDKQWHEDCLKCACCDCRLGEVGSSLFTHADKILCRRDFLRIFGQAGHCAACKKPIPPYELVMRAQDNAYHMDCFACQQCQYRFCVGDRFYLTEAHRIVCTLCQSEAGLAAPLAGGPSPAAAAGAPEEQPEGRAEERAPAERKLAPQPACAM